MNDNFTADDYTETIVTLNDPFLKYPLYADEYILRTKEETPRFLHRDYILSGYRVYFSFPLCLKSLFRVHNETVNVWTHLLGFLYFTFSLFRTLSTLLSQTSYSIFDLYLFLIFYGTATSSMSLSTLYHLCSCHSEKSHVMLYRCDLLGIALQIAGSYTPGLYYAFICYPTFQTIYGFIVGSLLIIATIINNLQRCGGEKYHSLRSFLLASIVLFAIVPSVHWYLVATPFQYQLFGTHLWSMLGFYALGFFIYYLRYPERSNPGKYDFWFHSHQFWHVCVFLAAYIWEGALIDGYNAREGFVCS